VGSRVARHASDVRYVIVGLVWMVAAIVAGATGLMAMLRPPAPQVVLVALTVLLLVAGRVGHNFRAWLTELGWRPLVAVHLTRFVGLDFLYLYQRGALPYAFAVPGGIGDVGVAALALALLLWRRGVERYPALLVGWNVLGLADILFVVFTAARLAIGEPGSMAALLRLPLSLLLTFVVPLIIATHVWLLTIPARSTRGG
jgi:hypothetical protein